MQQGFEFVLKSGIVVSEHDENEQHCGQANRDSKAGAKQYSGDYGQRTHTEISGTVYFKP